MRKRYLGRREFIKSSLALGLGAAIAPRIRAQGANNRVNLGLIGAGTRGRLLANQFNDLGNVSVIAVSDPDTELMERVDGAVKHQDYRRILEMPDIDAVIIASPNHWHASAMIAACQAGKHVYVEKPLTHCIWEGRKMVEAARKYKRIVQSGTQHRSCPSLVRAGEDLRSGVYGRVKWIHSMQLNNRNSIGKVNQPQPVPAHIDYNLWAGPAPMTPVMRRSFHYDWHWQWNWGDGEMGNWGVHYLDDLCNLFRWDKAPTSVIGGGGRFVWDDNGETPNMHFALMEHSGIPIVAEIRNLPVSSERRTGASYQGYRHGNIIQCENAVIKLSRGGGAAFDNDGNEIKPYVGNGGRDHASNFIDAIRSGRAGDLNAPVEGGVLSSAICQQANISYRLGRAASIDQVRAGMAHHDDALFTVNEVVSQINGNDGDLGLMQLGPKLTYDPDSEEFIGAHSQEANQYLRYEMRSEFAVPEQV